MPSVCQFRVAKRRCTNPVPIQPGRLRVTGASVKPAVNMGPWSRDVRGRKGQDLKETAGVQKALGREGELSSGVLT